MLPTLPIIWNNCLNKSCWGLNFIQKSQWMHKSISPKSGARGLESYVSNTYYIVLKWERLLSVWPLSKLLIISKNCSNKNFSKKSVGAYVYFPKSGAKSSEDWYVSNIILYWNERESRFTFGLNATKNTDYIKKCFK